MLVAVIVGLQFQVAALAGGVVCCTAFSLAAFRESAAEIFMAIVEAVLGFFGAIIAMIAAIFSGFFLTRGLCAAKRANFSVPRSGLPRQNMSNQHL